MWLKERVLFVSGQYLPTFKLSICVFAFRHLSMKTLTQAGHRDWASPGSWDPSCVFYFHLPSLTLPSSEFLWPCLAGKPESLRVASCQGHSFFPISGEQRVLPLLMIQKQHQSRNPWRTSNILVNMLLLEEKSALLCATEDTPFPSPFGRTLAMMVWKRWGGGEHGPPEPWLPLALFKK